MKKTLFLTVLFSIFSVFTVNAQTWDQIIKECASDRSTGSLYGYSVSISGDYAIVGALSEDFDDEGLNRKVNAGAAYILKNIDGTWTEVQKIVASDRSAFDYFGCSVAISGDYAMVGANMEDENSIGNDYLFNSGSVYLFYNNAGVWSETQKLVSSDREFDDYFGSAISMSGDVAIIGVYLEDKNPMGLDSLANSGSAYIFINNSGTWIQQQKLVASDRSAADYFGRAVSVDGDYAIIGAYAEDEDASGGATQLESGSAYIFKNTSGTWSQVQKIVASDRAGADFFGYSVAISGNYAIIGAYNEDENESNTATLENAGSAYIFENVVNVWTQVNKITNSDRNSGDQFGYSVSISGDYAIVGANLEDEDVFQLNNMHSAGSAYLYKNDAGNWIETQKIVPQDRQDNDLFGAAVAIRGNTAILCALQQDYDEAGGGSIEIEAGAVYFFEQALKYIAVKQDLTLIPNGSTFNMGNVIAGNSSESIVFTVENNGLNELNLSGDPRILISALDSPYFTIDQTATSSPIPSLDSTTFTITFNPDSARNYAVQISIANDDTGDNPYTFILNAIGNKIPQTIIDFDDISVHTYGDDPFQISASATSGLDVIFTSSDPSVAVCSGVNGTTVTILSAGVCDILANQPGNILWDVAPQVAKTLIVNSKTLTVNANAKIKTYGDADPEFTYSYTPELLAGDSFSGTLTRIAGEDANTTYQILQGTLTAGTNYIIIYNPENLTINPKTITITADAGQTKIYGTANPSSYTYSVEVGSLVGTDSFTGALTRESGENVGLYAILIGSLTLNSNYIISYVGDNFEITARPITITADAGQTKIYGLPDLEFTYAVTGPIIPGNSITGALSREAGEDVGFYSITIGTLSLGDNYSINFVSDIFEITLKELTVVVYPNQYKSYGQADPVLNYWITGVLVEGDSFTGALSREAGEAVGFYDILIGTLDAGPNYSLLISPAYFEIKIMQIVVIANPNQAKAYGDPNPGSYTYSYYGTLASGDSFNGALSRVSGEILGNYQITQGTLTLNSNYTMSFISDYFEITKRPITVVANSGQSKIYGEPNPSSYTYTLTAGSLVGTDNFTGGPNRNYGESAGLYTIHQGNLTLGSNYLLTFVSDNFEIIAAPITILADANQSKVYGEADPIYTYTVIGNLLNNDNFSGTLSRVSGENVGLYAIEQGTLTAGANYNLSFISSDFNITAKDIIISADANQLKVYGESDPSFTYTITGTIEDGDSFTGELTREAGENVGLYAIQQGTLELNANYNLSFVADNFEITKANPILTWNNPADIFNNIALSDLQLNATADIDGLFAYDPDFGSFLSVGDNQPLNVIFTPTDIDNYNLATATVYINVLLYVDAQEFSTSNIEIYPNPTNGIVNFDFANINIQKLQIIDLTGKIILEKNYLQQNETIDISSSLPGIYLIIIQTDKGIFTTKIAKE
jgi:hypothetical protein